MSETNNQPTRAAKGYLTDDQGSPSSMRLMSILALIVAAILAFVEVLGWGAGEGNTELVLYFPCGSICSKGYTEIRGNKTFAMTNSQPFPKANHCCCLTRLTRGWPGEAQWSLDGRVRQPTGCHR